MSSQEKIASWRLAPWLGVALGLLLAELAVRGVYWVPWTIDPDFGCVAMAGATATYRLEGAGISRWASHGVRRPELPATTDPVVVVLGDSFTESYMLDDPLVYAAVAEEQLRARQLPLTLLNLGRSGASPADYVVFAARYAALFSPRWTVIQLRDDDFRGDSWVTDKPHFVRSDAEHLTAIDPTEEQEAGVASALRWLRQRSALLNYGVIRGQAFAQATGTAKPLFRVEAPAVAPTREPVIQVEDELDAVMAAHGGRATVLYLAAFDPRAPLVPTAIEQRVTARCRARGWSCVNLRQGFPEFATTHSAPYGFPNTGFNVGHMNAAGHSLAGDLLADELARVHRDGLF